MNVPTVKELREKNCRVRVRHYRLVDMRDHSIFPRGGKTTVFITAPTGQEFYGEAVCSKSDNFCKKQGTLLAISRALGNN